MFDDIFEKISLSLSLSNLRVFNMSFPSSRGVNISQQKINDGSTDAITHTIYHSLTTLDIYIFEKISLSLSLSLSL